MFSESSTGRWAIHYTCHAAQASNGNFQKTYYKTFPTSCPPECMTFRRSNGKHNTGRGLCSDIWVGLTLIWMFHHLAQPILPDSLRRTQCDGLQPRRDLLRLRFHDGDERGDEPRLQRREGLGRLRYHLEHVLSQGSQHRVWIGRKY